MRKSTEQLIHDLNEFHCRDVPCEECSQDRLEAAEVIKYYIDRVKLLDEIIMQRGQQVQCLIDIINFTIAGKTSDVNKLLSKCFD